jgi:hypothetical protein
MKLRKIHLLITLLVVVFILIFVFEIFTETVNSQAYVFGSSSNGTYTISIEYKTKGAFIAGRPITVNAKILNYTGKLENKNVKVIVDKSLFAYNRDPYGITEGTLELNMKINFTNTADIIYFSPGEYGLKIAIDDFLQSGKEAVSIFRTGGSIQSAIPLGADFWVSPQSDIHIAPLETKLELELNKILIFLTISSIIIAFFPLKKIDE